MRLRFELNKVPQDWDVAANEPLLAALRRHGSLEIKHGCETGECGACTVLLDGVPVTSCTMLALQARGHAIETVEALGTHPEQGWKHTAGLHTLQQAFIETGAIQCGYCTPAQLLAAKALLDREPAPSEADVREALSGVLCRCTGYVKPVHAVMRAAAQLRGEDPGPLPGRIDPPADGPQQSPSWRPPCPDASAARRSDGGDVEEDLAGSGSWPAPDRPAGLGREAKVAQEEVGRETALLVAAPPPSLVAAAPATNHVGAPEPKVDAAKLSQGKPAFTADVEMRGMLVGKILHSPIAHGIIKRVNVSKARALPGVHAVLTHHDVPARGAYHGRPV